MLKYLGRKHQDICSWLSNDSRKKSIYDRKGPYSQSYGFSSSHIRMWQLDHKEGWMPKHWCFELWCWRRLESPLDCKEIKPVNPKGDQSWIFTGRTDAEAETPILWLFAAKSSLIGKDPKAGKDWGQEEKGTTEEEVVGWHHRLNGHEFEQAPGVGDGQGSLACCSPWGHKELDTTEWLTTRIEKKSESKCDKMWTNCCNITSGESVGIHCTLKSTSLQIWAILKSWGCEEKLADHCFVSSQHKLHLRASLQRCTGLGRGALTSPHPGEHWACRQQSQGEPGSPRTWGSFFLLAVLGLCCYAGFSLAAESGSYSPVAEHRL